MTSNLIFAGLIVLLLLFLIQTIRLHKRDRQLWYLQNMLVKQDRMVILGRLVAGICHELSTPFGAISCALDTRRRALAKIKGEITGIEQAHSTDEMAKLHKALKISDSTDPVLNEALGRCGTLIKKLRQASRNDQMSMDKPFPERCCHDGEALPPHMAGSDPAAPVDVNEVIRGSLLLSRHLLKDNITVVPKLNDVAPVLGWESGLGQVFLNLLVNSIQAVGDAGEILVASQMSGNKVIVTVSDSGPGLPAGAGDCVFNLGYTTKSAEDGTGMGLFISRRIISGHGGTIVAANTENGGAIFTISLPELNDSKEKTSSNGAH